MKKFIFSSALLMAVAAVSFAGNPKTETKNSSSETIAKASDPVYYWYPVTYNLLHPDGYIPMGTQPVDYATQSAANSPCEPGNVKDCIRGFEEELTEENNDLTAPSIKKP